jgi:DNA repair protein RecO (recombination protein O)|tara:strand:+ start:194 stop:868 length:675 start_codon:yes stop_codon:yes gene_type:complete
MNWEDEGFLLSKRKFRENANIISVFTKLYGKISGIVYGGNSRKIRNYLQLSNKIFVVYNSKNENKIGYFKTELMQAISPKYFDDKIRTTLLLSLTSILDQLIPIAQPYSQIYDSVKKILDNLDSNNWLTLYIFWELNLIKELGFGPDLINYTNNKIKNNILNIDIDGVNYQVPSLLVNKDIANIDNSLLKKSLTFTRSLMQNKFYIPNNIPFPKSRIILENYLT